LSAVIEVSRFANVISLPRSITKQNTELIMLRSNTTRNNSNYCTLYKLQNNSNAMHNKVITQQATSKEHNCI